MYKNTFFIILFISLIAYSCAPIPKLSKTEKRIIKEVIKSPIPDVVKGETGFAKSQGHSIWYESILPEEKSKGAVIFIMGNGNDALSWPPPLISNLVDKGYQVIRYDHRGTGLSTSEKKWKKKNAYSLDDMAVDVITILDKLKIQQAHIIGVSMGGMIGQLVAIKYPERTTSLTSIMSSSNVMDSELPPMSNDIVSEMISAILKHGFFGSKKGQIKRQIVQKKILMGEASGNIDIKSMSEIALYNLRKRKGYKLISARHHYEAILKSSSRLKALQKLDMPILVIHGIEDPVMPIAHGKKMARILSGADSLWIKNMGHDLPDTKINEMTSAMFSLFEGGK